MRELILSAAILLIAASTSFARDIYVSVETGSNGNAGTKEAPLKLLWKVIGDLQEGDHVYVAAGRYMGKGKAGVMPKLGVSKIILEGGWKADFSERDPFKHLTIIGPAPDQQGDTHEVFQCEGPTDITIDGFCIDRGEAAYYYADGEPGANKRIEGHQDNSCWGYRAMNRKTSGSDPSIELLGRGSFTVRNNLIVNSPWWGIYVKGGGEGEIRIENNLILICQGRAIESITGSGWGAPTHVIRNNTVAFSFTLKSTEGRALSIDPRPGTGKYLVENNVLAFNDEGGVTTKFGAKGDILALKDNVFFFNRGGDFNVGGAGLAKADEFEDELECVAKGNVHEMPKFLAKSAKEWFDRWSQREAGLTLGKFNKEEALMAARAVLDLHEYHLAGYDKPFANYSSLPARRPDYDLSRYPHPMKKGEVMDWAQAVLPMIGADGERGVRPFKAAEK